MRMRIAIAGAVIGTTAGITISRSVRTLRMLRAWGVDPAEASKALPGDDLVPAPSAIETRGIVIDAPPEAVWPWLVQMGYERGGWYSYDQLDNRGRSVERILPAFQGTTVGDILPVSPDGGFEARVVDPPKAFVLYTDTALIERQAAAATGVEGRPVPAGLAASGAFLRQSPREFAASWAFALEPLSGGRTRLIERFRVRFGAGSPAFRVIGPVMGMGVILMMRRQMIGIEERAVRTVVVPPLAIEATRVVPDRPARVTTTLPAKTDGRRELIATAAD